MIYCIKGFKAYSGVWDDTLGDGIPCSVERYCSIARCTVGVEEDVFSSQILP
jgi:hypothetical protein